MAMCVEVGTALIESFLDFGTFPCAFRVQTPLGPRKSGIPAEVLIPAPVKKMQWRAFRTRSAVSLTFLSNSAGESKRSTTCEGSLCWEERKLWEG